MLSRLVSAASRAVLVAIVIVLPTILLPAVRSEAVQMAGILALAAAALTFVEYVSVFPSFIEFRSAPPFNRMRFFAAFAAVLTMSLIARGTVLPSALTEDLTALGALIGTAMDFPFSPVRLMVLVAPEGTSDAALTMIRMQAGVAYLISLSMLLLFVTVVRLLDWPIRNGAFNFWVNLPLFDPTTGGDVLYRLKRDSHINVALGFLLPFLIPAALKVAVMAGTPISLTDSQPLIWTMIAWAFLPASLIMRGVALMRIADLIEEKRRRAYAQADLQPA